MSAFRSVLLVGTGDFSEVCAVLKTHDIGVITAESFDQAQLMLGQFCVGAVIAYAPDATVLVRLQRLRTPLVVVSRDLQEPDVACAALLRELDAASLPRVLRRVMGGERSEQEKRGAA